MSQSKETPEEYALEVEAVMADLDTRGGIARHKEYLKYYVNEAYDEETWPLTWDGLKKDFAISVVEIRRIGGFSNPDEGWTMITCTRSHWGPSGEIGALTVKVPIGENGRAITDMCHWHNADGSFDWTEYEIEVLK